VYFFLTIAQSSLLKYWEFEPVLNDQENAAGNGHDKRNRRQASGDSTRTHVERANSPDLESKPSKWGFRSWGRSKRKEAKHSSTRNDVNQGDKGGIVYSENEKGKGKERPFKKMPVCIHIILTEVWLS